MKSKRALAVGLLLAATLTMPWASAAQFVVKDVSNTIIACDGPLLEAFPPGSCLGYGPKALSVTITTASGEFELRCSGPFCSPGYDIYVVAFHRGRYYIYDALSRPSWQLLPPAAGGARPTVPWRLPLASLGHGDKTVYSDTLNLYLDDSYDGYLPAGLPLAELDIYVAISAAGKAFFTENTVKRIWPLP